MRSLRPFVWGLLGFVLAFLFFTQTFRVHRPAFLDGFLVPAQQKIGGDFQFFRSSAESTIHLERNESVYPPAGLVPFMPFLLLEPQTAFRVYAAILTICLFLAVFFSIRESRLLPGPLDVASALMLTAALYHTHWFQFELERGNSSAIVAALCAGGLLALSRARIAVAVLCLVVATQMKIYPAIFLAVILLRAGRAPALWFLGLNAVALFVLGWGFFIDVVRVCISSSETIPSPAYIGHTLRNVMSLAGHLSLLTEAKVALTVLFIALWSWVFIMRLKGSEEGMPGFPFSLAEVGLIGLAFQLMGLLPDLSFNYKLVIYAVPFLLLITRPNLERDVKPAFWVPAVFSAGLSFGFLSAPGPWPKAYGMVANVAIYSCVVLLGAVGQWRKEEA